MVRFTAASQRGRDDDDDQASQAEHDSGQDSLPPAGPRRLGRLARGAKSTPARPRQPVVKLRWKVENPDEDELTYELYVRPVRQVLGPDACTGLSVADRIFPQLLSLPLHPGLGDDDIDHVCAQLGELRIADDDLLTVAGHGRQAAVRGPPSVRLQRLAGSEPSTPV